MDTIGKILVAIMSILVAALIAIFVIMITTAVKQPKAIEHDDIMVEIECGYMNHRIFYDKETGVMYFENSAHGGITPMYNKDGTLKIYKE